MVQVDFNFLFGGKNGYYKHDQNEIMSKVVEHNGVVYVSGNTDDNSVGIKEQTEQVLRKIDGYLSQAGTDKSKLLSATVYVSDMLKPMMNEVWQAWLSPAIIQLVPVYALNLALPKLWLRL